MAIRGPQGPKPPPPEAGVRPAREQAVSPLQRLVDFGAARTPQEARRLVQELLASMRAAGFPVPATGSAEGQLGQALKLFQASQGLPPDGRIDKDTLGALLDAGLFPVGAKDAGEAGGARDAGATSRAAEPALPERLFGLPKFLGDKRALPQTGGEVPVGAQAPHDVEAEQKASAKDKPPEVDLKSFLSSMRAAGFFGAGKGAEQLKDALKKLQRAEGLPQSGHLDARTAEALVRRSVLPESALATLARESPAQQTASQAASGARSESATAQSDPTTRGLPQGQGDPDARVGRSQGEGTAAGKAGQAGDGNATVLGEAIGTAGAHEGTAVEDALERGDSEAGNAPAGDDDIDDERRGHANLDDEHNAEEDYWEAPPLTEQIRAGLDAIVRDDDGTGAATYAWDFTLLRPGVYGAKQPAERLFHLVVEKAGPFDPLWEQAREALNDKLLALEPEAGLLDADDFARTLRQARVRERSAS